MSYLIRIEEDADTYEREKSVALSIALVELHEVVHVLIRDEIAQESTAAGGDRHPLGLVTQQKFWTANVPAPL
jgi:hypothetical protein